MNNLKKVYLTVLIIIGISLVSTFYILKLKTPLNSTLTSFYSIAGKPVKTVDNVIGKTIPINDEDEEKIGIAIYKYLNLENNKYDKTENYINNLMDDLEFYKKKKFNYKIKIIEQSDPNAMALPGGVILITRSLLKQIKCESQLVAIIAHEMGHIELSHCMNTVKYNLLSDKVGLGDLGILGDQITRLLYAHSYSKTQENEADEYAFKILTESNYNPMSLSDTFIIFQEYENSIYKRKEDKNLNIERDYFSSHPPLSLRIEKYREKAINWWINNKKQIRYMGNKNFNEKITFSEKDFKDEWVSYEKSEVINKENQEFWEK